MAFNVNDFLANGLPNGGARPTLFQVDFFLPFATPNGNKGQFLCRAASIPPAPLDVIRVPYFGRHIKLAGDREFPNWQTTIMNDEDFPLRVAMEKWSNLINTLISNEMDPSVFPTGYKGSANVTQFGKGGATLAIYRFVGLFPVNVDQMRMDWEAQNQLQVFDVEFAYDYWEPLATGVTNPSPDAYLPTL